MEQLRQQPKLLGLVTAGLDYEVRQDGSYFQESKTGASVLGMKIRVFLVFCRNHFKSPSLT